MRCEGKHLRKKMNLNLTKAGLALEFDNKATKNYDDEKLITFENSKGLDLSFSDVSYSIRRSYFSSEKKKLLSNLSGKFQAGELTAIMGPSGAGKTVLMDILAGFVTASVSGDVMLNGKVRNLKAFRRLSTYIMQHHDLHDLLTVQESMHVAAELKLSGSSVEKKERINVMLKDLGLDEARTTFAGKLSGGQKKRLAIAMELIRDLPIMFFDEPTSGLDSVTTKQCVGILKSLARAGHTVICTIHQPSASLFEMLDNLYVISKGHCVYTGSPANVVPFLGSMGLRCPNYHNPADFLLEVASGEYGVEHIARLSEAMKNGNSCRYRKAISGNSSSSEQQEQQCALAVQLESALHEGDGLHVSSSWTQIRILLWRSILRTCRDRHYVMAILIAHLVMAVVTGLTFQSVGQEGSRAVDNFKHLSFNLIFISFCAINAALISFPAELPVMTREYFNRWYKLHSLYVANNIVGFAIEAFAVSSYTIITYYLSDQLPEFWRFGYLLLSSIAIALVNQAIGFLISVVFNVQNVVFLGPYSVMPFVLFSGVFMKRQDIKSFLSWIYDISIFKYAVDGFVCSIFGFDRPRMHCSTDYCHFASPRAVLMATGTSGTNYWSSTLVLVGVYLVLHCITYICLRHRLKNTKYR